MWGAYFLNYSDRQAVFSMFPVLEKELHLDEGQQGLVGAYFLWVYGALCPIAGPLADRFSKRTLVVLSLGVWSLVTIATGFATSATVLLALRAAMGVSESLYMPAAIALTANAHAPARRSRAIAVLTTAQIAGSVGGAWLGGWMADRGLWRGAFFVLGGIGLLYALPYRKFLRGVSEELPAEARKNGNALPLGVLTKSRTFLLLCVIFPMFVFGLWLIYAWLPKFLFEKFSLNLADAAFNATVFLQGATLLGLIGGGVLADWLFHRTKAARLWILSASLLLCAPCLYALGASTTLDGTRIAAACFGLFAGLLQGNIFPAAFEVVPVNARASAVGMLNFCGAALSGLATYSGGVWKKAIGIEGLLNCSALLYLVASALLIAGIALLFPRDYERMH